MNSRSAWFWAFTAAILFLGLVGYERFFHRPPQGPARLFPGLQAAAVQSVQVLPSGAPEIRAFRTNGTWELSRPLEYPAQANNVEALLTGLQTAVPTTTISGRDMSQGGADVDSYGLETPFASLVLDMGDGRHQLLVGTLTAPGDQVFVQVVGRDGVSVVDAELIKLMPATSSMWRDTGLFDLAENEFDTITVSSDGAVLELRRGKGDNSWQIVRPMTARADGAVIAGLLRRLRDLSVQRFISDDPRADRTAWGLQPAAVKIRFAKGSNAVQTLEFGGPVEGLENSIYAIGRTPSSVVAVPAAPAAAWQATPNNFRDRQLIRAPMGITSIEVDNGDPFSLVRSTNGTWQVEPSGFAADPNTVRRFIEDLQALRVLRFVKDVVAAPDLPAYGLADPTFKVVLTAPVPSDPDTTATVGLAFGSADDESVFVRRVDENAVYAVKATSLGTLPAAAGHFRERRVWKFNPGEVEGVSIQKGTKSWRLVRNGQNQWTLAAGSQGIVNAFAVEEAVHRLGMLQAVSWVDWDAEDTERYGLDPASITLTVELKGGSRRIVRFGFPSPLGHVYAGVMLDGSSWVFEFPGDTFDLVQSFLINPSNLR